jgi:hypothetical protein
VPVEAVPMLLLPRSGLAVNCSSSQAPNRRAVAPALSVLGVRGLAAAAAACVLLCQTAQQLRSSAQGMKSAGLPLGALQGQRQAPTAALGAPHRE